MKAHLHAAPLRQLRARQIQILHAPRTAQLERRREFSVERNKNDGCYGSADDRFDAAMALNPGWAHPCRSRPYRLTKGPTQ